LSHSPPIPVLQFAAAGYAVVGEAGLTWLNPAFASLTSAVGESPEDAAARLLGPDGDGLATRLGCRVRVVTEAGYRLIELLPTPCEHHRPEPQRDALTGVLARAALDREIADRFARRDAEPFALAFVDLDRFKAVNDRHGHLAGDACLREVGARLAGAVRAGDTVGRFGGDEFVLLLAGVTEAGAFRPVAERLRARITEPITGPGWEATLGLTIGVAYSVDRHDTAEQMLRVADRAMYRGKKPSNAAPDDVADPARLG